MPCGSRVTGRATELALSSSISSRPLPFWSSSSNMARISRLVFSVSLAGFRSSGTSVSSGRHSAICRKQAGLPGGRLPVLLRLQSFSLTRRPFHRSRDQAGSLAALASGGRKSEVSFRASVQATTLRLVVLAEDQQRLANIMRFLCCSLTLQPLTLGFANCP